MGTKGHCFFNSPPFFFLLKDLTIIHVFQIILLFLKFPIEAVDCFSCASLNFSNYIHVFVYDLLEMAANTFVV